MKKLLNLFILFIVSTLVASALVALECTKAMRRAFTDVPANHWAQTAIYNGVSKGYFKGYPDGSFKPNAVVNKAEFAVSLARVSIHQPDSERKHLFQDVKGHWGEQAIYTAIGLGFISPTDYPTSLKPDTPITRIEIAKWLAAGLSAHDADFKQALADTTETLLPIVEYYKGGISKSDYPCLSIVLGTGLLAAYPDGTFKSEKTITRAEAAVIIQRFETVQRKEAKIFRGLNELREVGTTGSNLMTVTPYKYYEDRPLKHIAGRDISLRTGAGKVKLHRMIVMDAKKWNDINSIYGPMFVDKTTKLSSDSDEYVTFIEVSVRPITEQFQREHFTNGGSILATGTRVGGEVTSTYGFQSLSPRGDENFFVKGKETRFWATSSIGKSVYPGDGSSIYSINTDDGKRVAIILEEG